MRASLPSGVRKVAAVNVALRQQLISVSRNLKRAPTQSVGERIKHWSSIDLERKLLAYQEYFNNSRGHYGIGGMTPGTKSGEKPTEMISLNAYRFKKHCNGLYQLPTAA